MKNKKQKRKKGNTGRLKRKVVRSQLGPVDLMRLESEYARAGRYMQVGQLHQAAEAFKAALRINPNHAQSINMLAAIALKDRQSGEAVKFARMAIQISPDNPGYYTNLGLAYFGLGEYEKAVSSYRKAIQLDPNYVDAYRNIGNALRLLLSLDEAVSCYQKALQLTPDDAEIYNELGKVFKLQGNRDKATEIFKKVLQLNPSFSVAHVSLAQIFERSNKLEEAREEINTALKKHNTISARLVLAKIEYRQEKYKTAQSIITDVLDSAPPYPEIFEALFLSGNILHKQGEYARAFQEFTRANRSVFEHRKTEILKEQRINTQFMSDPGPLRDWFPKEHIKKLDRFACNDGLPTPVFLVGFPRSGTTLLDQVLNSHSAIVTLEEKNTLKHIREEFCRMSSKNKFQNIRTPAIRYHREKYWEEVQGFLDINIQGRIIIDRDPVNTIYLGFINCFFP